MSMLHEEPLDREAMDDREHALSHEEYVIPVRVEGDVRQQQDAAKHSSFQSITLQGTEAPFQLLAFDRKRSRALIIITTTQATVQFVKLAKQEQVSNNGGALIPSGAGPMEYKAAPNVWVVPQAVNGQVTISVIEERNSE